MVGTRREAFTNRAVVQPADRRHSNVRWKRPKRPQRCGPGSFRRCRPGQGRGRRRAGRASALRIEPVEVSRLRRGSGKVAVPRQRTRRSGRLRAGAACGGRAVAAPLSRRGRARPESRSGSRHGCGPRRPQRVKPVAHTTHPVPTADDAARRDGMNIGPPPRRHLASRCGCHGGCPGVRDERKFSTRPITSPFSARA